MLWNTVIKEVSSSEVRLFFFHEDSGTIRLVNYNLYPDQQVYIATINYFTIVSGLYNFAYKNQYKKIAERIPEHSNKVEFQWKDDGKYANTTHCGCCWGKDVGVL